MIKRLLIAIVLLGLVGGGLVYFNFFRDQMIADFFANMPEQSFPVSTVEAEPVTWQPTISAIGTAYAARGVDLTVEAAGIVREINFAPNQEVAEGDILVRLDSDVQNADLQAARTQFEQEELALQRTRELQERGVATSVSLDGAQAALQSAEAQLARASALVDQRRLAAPFSGTIGLPRIDIGQYVSPGTSIATLQDLDTMRVDFSLPELQLPQIAIGQRLTVRVAGIDESFKGEIVGIDPRVDPSSRLVAVRGTIENSDGRLTPGQFVRIDVALPAEEGVVALPQTSVVSSLYGDYVYVVRASEGNEERLEVRQVFVETGRRADDLVEVSGIREGDRIVTAGQNRLSNGAAVTLSEAADGTAPQPRSEDAPADETAGSDIDEQAADAR